MRVTRPIIPLTSLAIPTRRIPSVSSVAIFPGTSRHPSSGATYRGVLFHSPPSDFTIEMDASDTGLCALDRAHCRVLTYRFSETELDLIRVFNADACNEFDINYRELLSCAFAVHAWAPAWRVKRMETPHTAPTHVHFRIDNTSAVVWQNKMSSSNTRAQTIIRLLSYWEMHFGLRFSSSHIPGADNVIADAGSRLSKDHHSAYDRHQWSGTDLARYLREHSVADSTYRKYERAFGTFITRRGVNPWLSGVPVAAQVQHVSDFILMGFQQGYGSGRPVRSATIANNLMGVRHFFQASGRHFRVDHPQIRMLLKGISRLDSPPERKAPVSIQLMEACFASLNLASFSDQALWGVLCLAFFFLLRRSEITSISGGKFRWFALKAQDVAVFDRAGNATLDASAATTVHIRLRGSKTNQAGQATTRMLRRSGHRFLCPVLGALLLLRSRRSLPAELSAAM
ncbi:hypothetical protein PHYSODRAFT_324441 [Phytophthora sojae]|uniref:Core-binding (CB) domain-containing protein n=1 Tax=Phytophthora sojae (strain P6497) TaxID=1094619 RepID=G4YWN4_PHYSP|nr:hypothetical protein PHYSODRAFT_324441 [Phytophthora sojae]EGZ23215.1 hypothetical protein PHYSODRAFT_324441 [Phytophthora sojae]|eukprot:XP_009518503.1 hypothetical protein PHYSODRAFT_324441 [Phytophthora sojae]